MYLIQFLLPLHDNQKEKFPEESFTRIRTQLTDKFGGVTAFLRSPAIGLWREDSQEVGQDDVVMFEVVTSELDKQWWAKYQKQLQDTFRQEEVLIWATEVVKL